MYLPVTTTFRVTDILRSYVAQAITSSMAMGIRFYGPSALQVRNEHSLIKDFSQEIPLYLDSLKMMECVDAAVQGSTSITHAMMSAYQELLSRGFVEAEELDFLKIWLDSVNSLTSA